MRQANQRYSTPMHADQLPTPFLRIDAQVLSKNLQRLADYTAEHGLELCPHTKTHKSLQVARMQLEKGAAGLTVAKAGEAEVMAQVSDTVLVAYPTVDEARCSVIGRLARQHTVRVGVDSIEAADALNAAGKTCDSQIRVLVDVDVGFGRTGVQDAGAALALAQHIDGCNHLRLDGIMYYPGHVSGPADKQAPLLAAINDQLTAVIDAWSKSGLEAAIVSGGSTPSAFQSHLVSCTTQIRPGTYVYHDMNCVRGGYAELDQCAARIQCTVVSNAVPGQVIIDAGSKTLTSDRCGPAPESGHGHIVEFPEAKITRLTEEHGQVDVSACDGAPKIGQRVQVVPNHICPCVNLHDQAWLDVGRELRPLRIDARGKVF